MEHTQGHTYSCTHNGTQSVSSVSFSWKGVRVGKRMEGKGVEHFDTMARRLGRSFGPRALEWPSCHHTNQAKLQLYSTAYKTLCWMNHNIAGMRYFLHDISVSLRCTFENNKCACGTSQSSKVSEVSLCWCPVLVDLLLAKCIASKHILSIEQPICPDSRLQQTEL